LMIWKLRKIDIAAYKENYCLQLAPEIGGFFDWYNGLENDCRGYYGKYKYTPTYCRFVFTG